MSPFTERSADLRLEETDKQQSRTQSPLAFWSAGGRPPADQKASGLWVRDWINRG